MDNRTAGEQATRAALDGLLDYWWALGLLYLAVLAAMILAARWAVKRYLLAPREDADED